MELIGPYLAACALLVVAGLAKAGRPDDTARAAVHVLGGTVGRWRWAVRTGAAAEVVVGAAALVVVEPALAGTVAASYVAFCGFVVVARHRGGPLASCGCFGRPDTPPTVLHASVDAGLALAAAWVAVAGPAGWTVPLVGQGPWLGIPLVLASAACAFVAVLALSTYGRLIMARRLFDRAADQRPVNPAVNPAGGRPLDTAERVA
ncbi:MAG TPA: MauE/DoxX family redox-associated membrane protein [Acidimicrobiales bacterium]